MLGELTTIKSWIRSGNIEKTRNYMYSVSESADEYAERKLRNTVRHFIDKGECPSLSVFNRKARVKKKSYPDLTRSAFTALRDFLKRQVPIPKQWEVPEAHTRKSSI